MQCFPTVSMLAYYRSTRDAIKGILNDDKRPEGKTYFNFCDSKSKALKRHMKVMPTNTMATSMVREAAATLRAFWILSLASLKVSVAAAVRPRMRPTASQPSTAVTCPIARSTYCEAIALGSSTEPRSPKTFTPSTTLLS